jgi:ribulose bisphosphate carboxylase small subunit
MRDIIMYKIQYELPYGIWESIVGAENENEAIQLLKEELTNEGYELIRIFGVMELKTRGVITDTLIFA